MNNETKKDFKLSPQELLFLRKMLYDIESRRLPNKKTFILQDLIKHINSLYSSNRELFSESSNIDISTGFSSRKIQNIAFFCSIFFVYSNKEEEKLLIKKILSKIECFKYNFFKNFTGLLNSRNRYAARYYKWLSRELGASLYNIVAKIIISEKDNKKTIVEMIDIFQNTPPINQLRDPINRNHLWEIFTAIKIDLEYKGLSVRKK